MSQPSQLEQQKRDLVKVRAAFEELQKAGMTSSAQFLSSFAATLEPKKDDNSEKFADTLFANGEYRRALKHFNVACNSLRLSVDPNKSTTENRLKQKVAACLVELKQEKSAYSVLQQVEKSKPEQLTTSSLLLLAKLAKLYEGKNDYPQAVDIALQLIDAGGLDLKDLKPPLSEISWLKSWCQAQVFQQKCDYPKAKEIYQQLLMLFPLHTTILVNLAYCSFCEGNNGEATNMFELVRGHDSTMLDYMDCYAIILKNDGKLHELNKLCHDLLQANPHRAETWTCIGIYCDAKGAKEKGLEHMDKALSLDPLNIPTLFYKGLMYKSVKKHDYAISSFRQAKNLRIMVDIYSNLVSCLVQTGRLSDAERYANEILGHLSANPRVQTLPALVLVHTKDEDKQKKGRELLLGILKAHPVCFDAMLAMAKFFKTQEKYDEGITFLTDTLKKHNRDFFHVAIAELYVANEKYDDAILHYNEALKLNPLNETASEGKQHAEQVAGKPLEDEEEDEEQPPQNDDAADDW